MSFKHNINIHALKALLKPVDRPKVNLGVGTDESHKSIPLLIFTEQHLPTPTPELQPLNSVPYEKMQKPGTGATLSLEDFETQNFEIGKPYGGVE